jgi:hypothetical protein
LTVIADTALTDAFTLRTRIMFYPGPSRSVPEITDKSPKQTIRQLRQRRAVHDDLFRRSRGLRHLEFWAACVDSVLRLQSRWFASKVRDIDISIYTHDQIVNYGLAIFEAWCAPQVSASIQQVTGNRLAYLRTELTRLVATSPDVFKAVGAVITEWNARLGSVQVAVTPNADESSWCELFQSTARKVGFPVLLESLSRQPWGLTDPAAGDIDSLLDRHTEPFGTARPLGHDRNVRLAVETGGAISFLIATAEQTLRRRFEQQEDRLGIGAVIETFLEIDARIKPIFDSDDKYDRDIEVQREILRAFYDEDTGMKYLRWNLVKVAALFDRMAQMIPRGGVQLMGPEVMQALGRLVAWFGIKEGELPQFG